MAKAYILSGQTGEYSDYRSWTVATYFDRSAAEAECKRLNDWCEANGLSKDNGWIHSHPTPEGDPNFRCAYTGTQYVVEETEFR